MKEFPRRRNHKLENFNAPGFSARVPDSRLNNEERQRYVMGKLWLLRHGESVWNLQNRFTGWTDVELSERGEREARESGEMLKNAHIDIVYCSVLKRAINTAKIALGVSGHGYEALPHHENQALNERHYGDLQGLNKAEIGKQYGAEQLHIWRRSYATAPPGKDGESLKDTRERVLPYWRDVILPDLKAGKDVLVSAHGNSIRALVMLIEDISAEEIPSVEIPTGYPFSYTFQDDGTGSPDVNVRGKYRERDQRRIFKILLYVSLELNAKVKAQREAKAAQSS